MKYYFEKIDSEKCYNKNYFIELMKDNDITEMEVYPAIIEYDTDYFWCAEFEEACEKGEGCGRWCEEYKPRNGKNGRCISHKNCYEQAEKPITLKRKL